MPQKEKNIFETIAGNGVRFVGDLALIVFPMGNGAIITYKDLYLQARRWAENKPDTHNLGRNIEQFCNQIDTYAARFGTTYPTKGHSSVLLKLAKAMQGGGMDIEEWGFPKDVVMEMMPEHLRIKAPAPKKAPEAAAVDPGKT